jgi:hypothetical protein
VFVRALHLLDAQLPGIFRGLLSTLVRFILFIYLFIYVPDMFTSLAHALAHAQSNDYSHGHGKTVRGAVVVVAPLLCEVAQRCGQLDIANDLTELGDAPETPIFQRACSLVADAASAPLTRLLALSSFTFLASTVRVLYAFETSFRYLIIN